MLECPDLLGEIARNRLTLNGQLQCAIGCFPHQVTLSQPLEVLILLQNATDGPMEVRLQLNLPRKDKHDNRLSFLTPRANYELRLAPLEVGVVHLPLIPEPPTPVNQSYPVIVMIQQRSTPQAKIIRAPTGGRGTSIVSTSPHKLNVLREVGFDARERAPGQLMAFFEVLPGSIPPSGQPPTPKYETLWTVEELKAEIDAAERLQPQARKFALALTRHDVTEPLRELIPAKFAAMNLPLYPGEVIMFAKLLTYVLEDGLNMEVGFSLEKSSWFQLLCRVMASTPGITENIPSLLDRLFPAIIWDATLLGLSMCSVNLKVDMGNDAERNAYAHEIQEMLGGQREAALSYVYLPFVMAGIILNQRTSMPLEPLSENLNLVEKALILREQRAGNQNQELFDLTQQLIGQARFALG